VHARSRIVAKRVPGYFSSNRALNPASARLLSVYQAPSNSSGWSLIEKATTDDKFLLRGRRGSDAILELDDVRDRDRGHDAFCAWRPQAASTASPRIAYEIVCDSRCRLRIRRSGDWS
jgi:hypothetical protein